MRKIAILSFLIIIASITSSCGKKHEEAEQLTETTAIIQTTSQPREAARLEITGTTKPSTKNTGSGIKGGTNQNDAVLLPMDTKLYSKVNSSGTSWFAFTTTDLENATYAITTVNKTAGTSYLRTTVYDKDGNRLGYEDAYSSGKATTVTMNNLRPNTTYYITLTENDPNNTIYYMIRIKNPNIKTTGYNTVENLSEAKGAENTKSNTIVHGTNQDDAVFIPLNAKVSDEVRNGEIAWFAFTTNTKENAEYKFTTTNESTGTSYLRTEIFDEYGKRLEYGDAYSDGKASTISINKLPPKTTYYIALSENNSNDIIHYSLNIQAPQTTSESSADNIAANVAEIENAEKGDLVFETPFELTETQVMFVAEQATFVNETAAKEALKPVADVILAHPNHSVLLAGTTATDGSQEKRVELSNKRAEAVKNLLIQSFGVPETQLRTIGLGFEADPFVRGNDRDANGKFVETEGAKNRRVVVLDVNDPIAQRLLQ